MPKSSIETTIERSERGDQPIDKYIIESIAKILPKPQQQDLILGNLVVVAKFTELYGVEFFRGPGNDKWETFPYDLDDDTPKQILELKKIKACSDCKSETCNDCGEPLPQSMLSFAKMTRKQRENIL
jgi:hypothetical protein